MVRVRRVQLPDELANQEIHIPARHGILEQRAVPLPQPGPVHAVHSRVVEEVPLEAEHVGEHLPPLGARIDGRFHLGGDHGLLELLRRLDVEDRELVLDHDEHLPAVRGGLEPVGLIEDCFLLALREVEIHNRVLLLPRSGARGATVQQLALDRLQVGVVASLWRQHDRARLEAVEIDIDVRGSRGAIVRFFLLRLFFLGRLLVRLFVVGFFPVGFLLVLFLVVGIERGILGVVARGERRLHVAAQRHRDELRRVGIGPGVVEAAVNRIELAVRRVKQILPFRLERRLRVVEVTGGGLVQRGILCVVQKHRAVRRARRSRVGEPARVGRPLHLETLQAGCEIHSGL